MNCSFIPSRLGGFRCTRCNGHVSEIQEIECAGPKLPPLTKQAANLGKAVVKHVKDGMKKVTRQEYQDRLNICNKCLPPSGFRVKTRCTHESCGCFISTKVWWASEDCPLGKW